MHFGTFWGYFGSFWGLFGVTLGHFGVTLGHVGVALGSIWGRIRFWTAPCAKVIRFAERDALRGNLELAGTHRESPEITAGQLQTLAIYQSI